MTELYLRLRMIEDLPTRVSQILDYLYGEAVLPDDFKLPKDPFFAFENWQDIMGEDFDDYIQKDPEGVTYIHCTPNVSVDVIRAFLRWLLPYVCIDTENTFFMGHILEDDSPYPTLVMLDRSRFFFSDMKLILGAKCPIMVDNEKGTLKEMPTDEEKSDLLKSIFSSILARADDDKDPIH